MDSITLSAYAKINLTLAVTGKREDGYHTLESVMQSISLADTVSVQKISSGILILCDKPGIPTDEKNLCYKAAKRYLEKAGMRGGVKITLSKQIPDGAGLGGGSADAAATLRAMQALFPAQINLFDIGATIGADVPFCLAGGTQFCSGIGDELSPLCFPEKKNLFCVVLKNCQSLSTPRIYGLFDLMASEKHPTPDPKRITEALEGADISQLFSLMQNDLELPAVALCPEIALGKAALLSLGAQAAMMTGSGSAVYGLFLSEKEARAAADALNQTGVQAYFCTLI